MKTLAIIGAIAVIVVIILLIGHYTTRPKTVDNLEIKALNHEAAGIFRQLLVPTSLDSVVLLDDFTKKMINSWLTDYNKETADK